MEFKVVKTPEVKTARVRGKYASLILAIKALKVGQSIVVPANSDDIILYRSSLYSYQSRKLIPRIHINRCEGGLAIRIWD